MLVIEVILWIVILIGYGACLFGFYVAIWSYKQGNDDWVLPLFLTSLLLLCVILTHIRLTIDFDQLYKILYTEL